MHETIDGRPTSQTLEQLRVFCFTVLGVALCILALFLVVPYTLRSTAPLFKRWEFGALGLSVLVGIGITLYWLRTERRAELETMHYVLRVIIRYFLAFIFLTYGFAKLYRTQFYEPPLVWQDTPLGELSGFQLTWAFFGYSYPYSVFIGASQIGCAALLLFRRTWLLGALGLLPIIGNIVFVNFAYDIPVKFNSVVFLAMATYLALTEAGTLKAFFWDRKPVILRSEPPRPAMTARMRYAVASASILIMLAFVTWRFEAMTNNAPRVEHPVYGVWEVTSYASNGEVIFAESEPRDVWTKLIFEAGGGGRAALIATELRTERATYTIDPEDGTLEIDFAYSALQPFVGQYVHTDAHIMVLEGYVGADTVRVELRRTQ